MTGSGSRSTPPWARSVSVIPVAGQAPDVEQPGGPQPAHLAFSISGLTREKATVPGPWTAKGVINVYETADLEPIELAAAQLDQLRTLLADRPDLAPFMAAADPSLTGNELPYLPVPEAARCCARRRTTSTRHSCRASRMSTGFRQDVARFAATDFWYTFQGLTGDGSRYVALTWVLTAPGFPRRVSFNEADDDRHELPALPRSDHRQAQRRRSDGLLAQPGRRGRVDRVDDVRGDPRPGAGAAGVARGISGGVAGRLIAGE